MNPYESFYHGLIFSKLWLCEKVEPFLVGKIPIVYVLGGWHNVMSFMMIVRNPNGYKEFHSYDIDADAVSVADQICGTWKFENPKVYNYHENAENAKYSIEHERLVINCSMDQMENNDWFDVIPKNSLVCIQTTDCHPDDVSWEIKQHTPNLDEMIKKFPKLNVLFSGSKRIQYEQSGYTRLMLIGTKL